MDYWEECISQAFDEAGIKATPEQIAIVVDYVDGAQSNYGTYMGYDMIPNPMAGENKRLAEELRKEKDKITCQTCKGEGSITNYGPYHSATSRCWKCHGEGRHAL